MEEVLTERTDRADEAGGPDDYAFIGALFLLAVTCLLVLYGVIHPGMKPIRSDGVGYYLYYPTIFLYGDPKMVAMMADLYGDDPVPRWTGVKTLADGSGYITKYTIGVAVLGAPLYAIATAVTLIPGVADDVFAWPYGVANMASGLVAFLIGTFGIVRVTRVRFDRATAYVATLFCIVGTAALHYATFDAFFSHIYGYGLVGLLLYLLWGNNVRQNLSRHALIGLVVGLMVIVRPTNAVFGLFYLAWLFETYEPGEGFLPLVRKLAVSGLASGAAVMLQIAYWYAATGNLFVYAYGGERFNFSGPAISYFLLGMEKGVFVWTPVFLLGLLGLIPLARTMPVYAATAAFVMVASVYVHASWHSGFSGGGFASRTFVEFAPLLALPLASLLTLDWRWSRPAILSVGSLASLWTGAMMWGYWIGTMPYSKATGQDMLNTLRVFVPFV